MKDGEPSDQAQKTAFQCARAGAAAGLLVAAGLLALPLDAAVNGQSAFQGRPLPVIDRNFHTVVAVDDGDTLEGASRHTIVVAQATSDIVPIADAADADESHVSDETPWRGRELGLWDRVQDWLARANRQFQTVIIRRLSVGSDGETETAPPKTEGTRKEDLEAARDRAEDAITAAQAKRQEEFQAAKREKDRLAALVAEQRRESERLKAEAARLQEQQRLEEEQRKADEQKRIEEAHQRALADAAEKAAEDAKRAAAEREAQRAAAKAAEEKAAQEAAARDAAEKQRLADERAAKEAEERARQEAAEKQRLAEEEAAQERAAKEQAAKEAEAKAQAQAAALAAEKQRLADEEAARARAAEEAEEKARAEAAAKEAVKEAAERQQIAEAEAAKEAAQKESEAKAAAPAVPPAAPVEKTEPVARPRQHEAQLVREARNVHLARGPVVKRWVRRARTGRCRYSGRKIVLPGRYVIARGDSLWRIALRHYRSGLYFMRIYRANRDIIRSPNRIYPCQRIYLPRKHG